MFTKAKKGTPFTLKALSSNFAKTLDFGIVRESEDAIAKKYKVKKWPSLIVIKSEGKPIMYDKDDFSYKALFEHLNVYSQIFVDPNAEGNEPKQNAAAKPWLTKSVPKLTKDSGNDICLKRDGTLCVIFVTDDDSKADSETLQMLNNLGQDVTSKIARGIQFNFMWLNSKDEPEFAKVLDYEEGSGN